MTDPCYGIADAGTIDLIRPELARWFNGIRESSGSETFEVMDSFDWRLFTRGWLLHRTPEHYRIVDIHTGQPIVNLTVKDVEPLQFHWEFPESDFARSLQPVLEMRALLPLGLITRQWFQLDLLNNDEKIVARMALETYRLDGLPEPVRQCRVMPVRGYPKPVKRIAACLDQLGLQPAGHSPILTLLERKGLSPGGYSSKINVSLQPDMPAAEAVRRILDNLIAITRMNLPGVKADIDSEFLHDLRVSLRRARSLLSQMKGVFDARTAVMLQRQLKALGAVTGTVRDLDVVLLKREPYINLVPDYLKPGITILFRTLQRQRHQARDRMVRTMDGVGFEKALGKLEAFVQAGPVAGSSGPGGDRPIGELARAAIYQRYRRIIKQGRRISDATPDEKLHALRIDCKKLRYLLEFFTSLFPAEAMSALVKQLKQLQDNLGAFNDLSVQQRFLIHGLETVGPQTAQVVMLAAATGGLITRLSMLRRQLRSKFINVFNEFDSPDNQRRFKELFA